MARRSFFSFHYKPDSWRAAQVRNMGMVDGNKPVTDNDWETITKGGPDAINKWIAGQLKGRSCTIVLVGTNTANDKMGVVGIYIHGLENSAGKVATKGSNPFAHIPYGDDGKKLSSIVKCYTPPGSNGKERYDWIKKHLADAADEAVKIRGDN